MEEEVEWGKKSNNNKSSSRIGGGYSVHCTDVVVVDVVTSSVVVEPNKRARGTE